jgi:uncharacterized protein YggT (Ycf19 family)
VGIVCLLIQLYVVVVFVRIILSWFPLSPGGLMAQVFSVSYTLTEPVLGPIRRAIPPVRMGGGGLDLSPIIVLFGSQLLLGIIC